MKLVTQAMLEEYERADGIARLLAEQETEADKQLVCHQWLAGSAPKRMIYEALYGDLLAEGGKKVLDVGGGLTALAKVLAAKNDYTLTDLLAHDVALGGDYYRRLIQEDWHAAGDLEPPYDVVIANDLFPNVDQRLALFLEKFLPLAREIRLSLTYYKEPRFYVTKRLDGDEILTLLAWDHEQTRRVLERFTAQITAPDFDLFDRENPSVYPNKRQVMLVTLKGEA